MTIIKPYIAFFLLASILSIGNGCATLPDVSEIMDETQTAQNETQIVSSKGLLSPQKSKAIMERLKRSVPPTDILERHAAVTESVTESPLTKGNKVTLLADGQVVYAAMFKAMQKAKDHINLESYIIENDETGRKFGDLLLQKHAEGVQVNIIYDSMGSMNTPASFFQRLRDNGIQVVGFNPINPLDAGEQWKLIHRDHRKILIVDGSVAIIGGVNISKVYSSNPFKRKKSEKPPIHWRDTDIQVEGPAVAEFQKLFFDSWSKQKGPKLPERNFFPEQKEKGNALVRVVGSTPGETNRIPFIVYVSAITFAEHSIHMTNSYFIPDKQILKALTDAAKRGVDVKIILPGITDSQLTLHAQRHHYAELLKAGVKLYECSTVLLHAKSAVIDTVWSTVGSTNMDTLSMLNNDEVNAIVLNHDFAVEMEKMFVRDLANSRQIQWSEWQKRPLLPRVREWFVNLFDRWL
ncbi:cardiolipin synthase [Oryzomonas japonica]|uniref:Cardiolipin synthase n=1 Tax=Oryzomonas japonica TaxID=2603858 RepID=A0A7J4ZM85_9BACT|nr:cardiolipin synthase [Oryzomonas japonica]KAB0663783.1 cardiolipin synthase [Oryzomonas japonica]